MRRSGGRIGVVEVPLADVVAAVQQLGVHQPAVGDVDLRQRPARADREDALAGVAGLADQPVEGLAGVAEHVEPGEQGAVGTDVVDVEDLGDRRPVRDVDAAPRLARRDRRGGPSCAPQSSVPDCDGGRQQRQLTRVGATKPSVRRVMSICRKAPPDPDLLDAEPLAVGKAAVGDGQVLAPEAPGEALERLRLPLGAGHVLRLRIADPAVLVDQVGRHGRKRDWPTGPVHVLTSSAHPTRSNLVPSIHGPGSARNGVSPRRSRSSRKGPRTPLAAFVDPAARNPAVSRSSARLKRRSVPK